LRLLLCTTSGLETNQNYSKPLYLALVHSVRNAGRVDAAPWRVSLNIRAQEENQDHEAGPRRRRGMPTALTLGQKD